MEKSYQPSALTRFLVLLTLVFVCSLFKIGDIGSARGPLPAWAGEEQKTGGTDVLDPREYPVYDRLTVPHTDQTPRRAAAKESQYGAGAGPEVNFGDQIPTLSGLTWGQQKNAKAVYDSLTAIVPGSGTLSINLPVSIVYYSASEKPTDKERESVRKYIQIISQTAIDALLRDYPEIFWLDVGKGMWYYSWSGEKESGRYKNVVSTLRYTVAVASQYNPPAGYQNTLEQAIERFPVSGSSRYDKVKSIHDALCRRIVYGESSYAHQIYGALVPGRCVCEGYAKAFKAICDREKIPCVLVSGSGINSAGMAQAHMWNQVQMEDGKWYGVDVTWDDQSDIIYDYFLCGSTTAAAHSGGRSFSAVHKADGDFNQSGFVSYAYPVLAQSAYDKDAVKPAPDPTPVPSPRPLPDPSLVYGDLNRSGEADTEDALTVLKAVVKLVSLTETEEIQADLDGNWQVQVNDALLILKKAVRLLDRFPVEDLMAKS